MKLDDEFIPLYGVEPEILEKGYKINSVGLILTPDNKFLYGYSKHKKFNKNGTINKKHGYKTVSLYDVTGKHHKNYSVHRLVYMAFHRVLIDSDEEIHHINKDKSDNSIYNLRKLTKSQHRELENLSK